MPVAKTREKRNARQARTQLNGPVLHEDSNIFTSKTLLKQSAIDSLVMPVST
jgi:hypothetical protein